MWLKRHSFSKLSICEDGLQEVIRPYCTVFVELSGKFGKNVIPFAALFNGRSKQDFGFSNVWKWSLDMQKFKKSLQDPVCSLLKSGLKQSYTKVVKIIIAHANCKHAWTLMLFFFRYSILFDSLARLRSHFHSLFIAENWEARNRFFLEIKTNVSLKCELQKIF